MLNIFDPNSLKNLQLAQSGTTPRTNICYDLLIQDYRSGESVILLDLPQADKSNTFVIYLAYLELDKLLKRKRTIYRKSKRAWRRNRKTLNRQINLVRQKIN